MYRERVPPTRRGSQCRWPPANTPLKRRPIQPRPAPGRVLSSSSRMQGGPRRRERSRQRYFGVSFCRRPKAVARQCHWGKLLRPDSRSFAGISPASVCRIDESVIPVPSLRGFFLMSAFCADVRASLVVRDRSRSAGRLCKSSPNPPSPRAPTPR